MSDREPAEAPPVEIDNGAFHLISESDKEPEPGEILHG